MSAKDTCCTIAPYMTIHEGKLDEFKSMCETLIRMTEAEPKCLFYGFSFDGHEAYCREGYADAEGLLAHLDNVGAKFQEALKISTLHRLEIHGPGSELAKLREPLKALNPQYYSIECGFRR